MSHERYPRGSLVRKVLALLRIAVDSPRRVNETNVFLWVPFYTLTLWRHLGVLLSIQD